MLAYTADVHRPGTSRKTVIVLASSMEQALQTVLKKFPYGTTVHKLEEYVCEILVQDNILG